MEGSEEPTLIHGDDPHNDIPVENVDTGTQNQTSGHSHENAGMSLLNVNIPGKIEDWGLHDMKEVKFDSVEEAENFYNNYSKYMGFGVRKRDRKVNKYGKWTSRSWVCCKEGVRNEVVNKEDRKREARSVTRVRCHASFKVKFDKGGAKYKVEEFVPEHNHDRVAPTQVHLLRSHRSLKEADKAQVEALRGVGVKPSQIMDLRVNEVGGYNNVGFTLKDLYNFVNGGQNFEVHSDAESALAYLRAKYEIDSDIFCKFTLDEDDRLKHIFWADSTSRVDYSCFGDVLVFYSTYKTNAYKMPLVVFVGVNHHHATTVFGSALLPNETVESYNWVVKTFLEAMKGKHPSVVITDGCKSMRRTIKDLMPDVVHRVCCWHLRRNAESNVSPKEFLKVFDRLLKRIDSVEEFEDVWRKNIEEFQLGNNEWLSELYEKRERWAQAFFTGTFTAGMKSSQRVEGMNSYLNQFMERKLKLYELFIQFDRGLRRLREKEVHEDFVSVDTFLVCDTHLRNIEEHFGRIYTRKMFFKVRKRIKEEPLLYSKSTTVNGEKVIYEVSKYSNNNASWIVVYYPANRRIECSCQLLESKGIPCSHCFFVMKVNNISVVPSSLVVKRWCKDAKKHCVVQSVHPELQNEELHAAVRSGNLNASFGRLCRYASKTEEGYKLVKQEIGRLTVLAEEIWRKSGGLEPIEKTAGKTPSIRIKDPRVVKTKGRKSESSTLASKRHCSHCSNEGHDVRKCPQKDHGNTGAHASRS